MKPLQTAEIFYTSWQPLTDKKIYLLAKYVNKRAEYIENELYQAAGQLGNYILELITRPGKKKIFKQLTPEQKTDIIWDMTWIMDPWTHFPVDKITLGNVILEAPAPKLAKCTFQQFKYLDATYTKAAVLMHHGQDQEAEEHTEAMISGMYLPKGTPFHPDLMKENLGIIRSQLKPYQKAILFMTYGAIRSQLIKRSPTLFALSPDEDKKPSEAPQPVYTGMMWQHLHFDLAETDAFRGFDQAGSANIYDVLDYLERKTIQNQKATAA